ncbi:FAD/NAD(P)-binding domain-containing protein [Coniophora puteana RWD-64-598 SS2]|uniref:FAD/NAD(P)-binding domain-containing protein n=1 Tax=Coniophora puteana (strain RWD-64-598) TaxID=741705 RepID=A0A5M3MFL0_CONPW|nr:FAD/NAD(P)-binding domain-containing protein [Coniophora puteana RWD-64-598 SS2]EIW77405.1 FAD/NAD(P)-binding domain-containing protein [Coniophora puteana RWD-64-598 SS2]
MASATIPLQAHTESVAVVGSGAAGLITAHTLIQDGFRNVVILSSDKHPGGVWSQEHIYPGIVINNVHGEYRFSSLPMPPSPLPSKRVSGDEMRAYMEHFAETFLTGRIRYGVDVSRIRRKSPAGGWSLDIVNKQENTKETRDFAWLVLCTGGCSKPYIPESLSFEAAIEAGFTGHVFHSSRFAQHTKMVEELARRANYDYRVVIAGGGKSAQDLAAYLAQKGIDTTVVFETTDAIVAVPVALPDFIRKSRVLSIMASHIELRTRLEQFLHTTWLGSKIVKGFWNFLSWSSYKALSVPQNSPMRRAQPLFWSIRANDEGAPRSDSFFSLVSAGKIKLESPARVASFGEGHSVHLDNGQFLKADVLVLATGFESSWGTLFDDETAESLGINRHAPSGPDMDEWHYMSLNSPPPPCPQQENWASSIYRGIVPAKNLQNRDFAINGAVFTTNPGYAYEVTANWISSYFLGDTMRLPSSSEEALVHTERNAAWLRKRYPGALAWINESYSSSLAFWSWPQMTDELLEDMGVTSMRSGGNWFTWPFRVISVDELKILRDERRAIREKSQK